MKTSITDKLEKARINFALRGCEANEIKVLDAFECVKQAFKNGVIILRLAVVSVYGCFAWICNGCTSTCSKILTLLFKVSAER